MISESLAAELLTATVTSLWVGGLCAGGVALLVRCLPTGPLIRYRLWGFCLLVAIIAPLVRLTNHRLYVAGKTPVPESRSAPAAQRLPEETSSSTTLPAEEAKPLSSPAPAVEAAGRNTGTVSLDPSLGMFILLLWVVGALIRLAWLAFQVVRLLALKQAGSAPGERLTLIWNDVSSGTSRRPIRFLLSQRSRLPAACGYFQPAIIAPATLCQALTEEETRHLLLHELAHLNRYDDWWLLAHRLVQSILWWHPVVWYVSRKLDTERELACDEVVVEGRNRRQYARTLVRVAEVARGTTVELAPGVLRGDLTRRIEALLQMASGPTKPVMRARAGVAAASTVALAIWLSPPAIRFSLDTVTAPIQNTEAGPAIASHLDTLFAGYADSGFSGSILLAMGDEIVLAKGYGMADRERGIPATAETRYSVAGFTKMFTAAAVLTLEAEGRLRTTDSLVRFFGPLPGTDGQVTLHQLLTHTDGLTRQNAPVYRADPRAFIRAVSATPDSFAPGQGYRYNDFGHSVLGVVVEQVSGTPYEVFIRDRFLEPAGLSQTGFENEDGVPYAQEYAGPPGNQYPIPPRSYTWGRRASLGMVSTIGDMYRWVQAMSDPRVLSPEARTRMLESHGSTDWGAERGYGWDRIRQRNGNSLWRRVAGTPGMEGEILYDPARGWTAVILVNSRVEWRFRVWDDIADAIDRRASDAPAR